jgi:hypothetical protein
MNLLHLTQNNAFIRFGLRLTRGMTMLLVSAVFALATYTLVRAAPTITATLTDTFIGGDGDGKADPGETIEYTAIITNSGADPATGVTFNDILDLNTTLVAGSVNVSPLAGDDAYQTIGNTLLEVGVTASGNPAVIVSGSLFDNDIEFLADTFTLKSVEADTSAPFTNVATEQSGLVTVESDGNFSYTPAVGFSGTDNFDYVITDDGPDNVLGNADDLTGAGRVTITVTTQRVWYVKNDAAPSGVGRSSDPFDTLLEAQTASAANDTIYVFTGNGTTSGQNAGITLKSGQRLLGNGVALTVPVSVNGGPNPTTLRTAGTHPLIAHTAGNGVSVTTASADATNVEIRGLNIAGGGAGNNAIDFTTSSTFGGSVEIANNVISAAPLEGVDINGGGSGTLTVSIHDNTVTATGNGIDIVRTAGNLNITAFDDNNVNGATGGIGINVVGTGASILFDANLGTASFDAVSGGGTTIGQSGNGVGTSGLVLSNIRGDLNFTDLDIFSDNGTALFVNGTSPNYTGTSGTRVTVTSSVSTLSATGGAAADITDVNVNLVLTLLSSANSTGSGVALTRVSGTFTVPSGSAITNASSADVSINGGSNGSANVAFTYGGTITDDLGTLVQIQNVTATSAHSFTGAITDNNDGDGNGISLTGNSGATITFSGGLLVSTGANPAFTATGGGTVNVCDENPCNPAATGALVNTLTATTGTALNVANTTIGANGMTFRSITSTGGTAPGIILNTTGNTGVFTVTGNGGTCTSAGTCTGGSISGKTGSSETSGTPGIRLNNVANVRLNYMNISGNNHSGIYGTTVNGFQLDRSNITANGDTTTSSPDELGVDLNELTGTGIGGSNPTSITNTRIFNNWEFELQVTNTTGTLTDFQMSGNTISSDGATGAHGNLVNFLALGSANMTLTTTSGTFTGAAPNTATGIQCDHSGTSGTVRCNVSGSTFTNNNVAVSVSQANGGNLKFIVNNNIATGNRSHGLNLFVAAIGTGTVDGDFTNNTVGTNGVAGSGSSLGFGIRVQNEGVSTSRSVNVLISGNTVQETASFSLININQGIAAQTSSTATNATITGNTLQNSAARAIIVQQNNSTDADSAGATCVDISGNTMTNIPGNVGDGTRIRLRRLDANSGGGDQFRVRQTSAADLATQNPNIGTVLAHISTSGTMTYNGGICTQPNLAVVPDNNLALDQNQSDTASMMLSQTTNASIPAYQVNTSVIPSAFVKQTSSNTLRNTSLNASVLYGGKPLFSIQPVDVQPAPVLSGETVTVPAFTLPAGKSVTIKYRVTVDNPLPQSATKIQTQATISGSNFSNVFTTNGGTADCETGGETCTPIDLVDLTATKSNDTSGTVVLGNSFDWSIDVSNIATSRTAIFTNGQTVLEDHLPTGPTYGSVSENYDPGVVGTMTCSISSNVLTCTADAGGLTIPSGADFTVSWQVTPNAGGSLVNPTGGVCQVDPNAVFAEVGTANNSCSDTVTVTRPNTTVTSINRQTPSGTNTNASSVTWRVTFANAVSGVTSSNFTLTDVSSSITGESISTVTAVGGAPATQWDVTVSTGTGDGTLRLDFANDTGMNYAVTNAPYTSGQTYTVDKTSPLVSSIVRQSPVSSPTNSDVLVFRVTFNEAVTSVGASSFVVNGTTTTITSVGSVTPNLVFDLTLDGGVDGNLSNLNGTVGLNIAASPVITDLAGNTLQVIEPTPAATNDQTYDVDNSAPSATSFTRQTPSTSPTNADTLVFRATFSEDVTGVGTTDFAVNGTTTATVTGVNPVSASVYDVTVSGGDLASFNGVVGLNFSGGMSINDLIGNALPNTEPSTDETYTLDNTAPTVTNVTSSTANGTYTVGNVVSIQVEFSEAVTVTGTPQLTLETGTTDRVVNYSSGSGTNTLTFDYTVQAGDTSNDLDYAGTTALALNSGTVRDAATNNATLTLATPGNAGSLGANKSIVIDTTSPTVTNVSSTQADGSYGTGVLIPVTVTFSEPVIVTGTPQLTLETGATDRVATYISGSGTNTLTFNYTTQNGDTSADLDYVGINSLALNGGTIQDAVSNNADLALATPGAAGSLAANKAIIIDATEPGVTNVTSSVSDGSYTTGNIISIDVTFSEIVNVTGTPQLTLETGAIDRTINYVSGGGTNTLTFSYTVQAGDATADLDYVATNPLTLNGGTIQDVSTNDAILTLPTPSAAGSLGANKNIVIDTSAPTVTSVTSSTVNGSYTVGQVISIQVVFSENVNVTGTPQLTLETGTTDRTINYASGSTTDTLTFNYTVQAGDTSNDLDYTGTTALTLNSGTIQDVATNNALLTLPAPGAAGSLAANKAIEIDTATPTVTSVSSTAANGSYTTGALIPVTITFSKPMIVTGTPQLTLETGTTDRVINYASGSGSVTLTFNYTVQAGDTSSDLDYVDANSLSLNSGTIKDAATNDADLTLPAPAAVGSLGDNKNIVIDTTAATVTNVTSTKANGAYLTGVLIPVTVTFSEPVTVTGTPQITLETGVTDRLADYVSGSGTNTLTFNYTTQNGDTSADLDYVAANSLALNSGTIQDAASNDADLTLPTPGAAGSLGANKDIVIDATEPTIVNVTSNTVDGSYSTGASISIEVTFSESVTVTGTPRLTLETGATDRVINYTSGSGSDTLTFSYTVQAGDTSSDLDYVATTSLALNGGTIRDASTNNAILTLPTPGAAGSLAANKALVIDTAGPTVANVTSPTANGTYPTGAVISITVTFNENVIVTGLPQLTLETGATNRVVNYTSGSGSDTLTFNYTVQAGDSSPDLDYVATTSLALNGGTIKDTLSNNASLTLPAPGAAGSLGANKAIVIDTSSPTVVIDSTEPNPTNASPIPVTITFNESVINFVEGDITVSNGTINNFAGTGANYTFDLVPAGQGLVTVDIAAGVAEDSVGNLNTAAAQFSRTYDSVAPDVEIDQASGQPDPASVSPVNFTAVFDEPVTDFNDAADVTLSGTAGANTIVITELSPMDGTTYRVAVSGMLNPGTVTVSIPMGAAQDAAGNPNTASTSSNPTVTVVQGAPIITEGAETFTLMSENGNPIPFELTLHATTIFPESLSWTISTSAGAGTASVGASTGMVSYTPTTGFIGEDSFEVQVTGSSGSDTILVHVTVQDVDDNSLVNDDSYRITYNTWFGATNINAIGGGYRQAKTNLFVFRPNVPFTKITWFTYRGPDRGMAEVIVDGVVRKTVDLYSPTPEWKYRVNIAGLPNTLHFVVIRPLNTRNPLATGKWITVDGFKVGNKVYDDKKVSANGSLYSGGWGAFLNPSAFQNGYRLSKTKNATATFTFVGTEVVWVTARGPAYGKAQVYIDNVLVKTVSLYSPIQQWKYKVTMSGLPSGVHKLVIKVLGKKHPLSIGTGIMIDYFETP